MIFSSILSASTSVKMMKFFNWKEIAVISQDTDELKEIASFI
jgi:hypothetical protein